MFEYAQLECSFLGMDNTKRSEYKIIIIEELV
jgi:hypothetical protein